jgi:ATP-binding cassette subfamily F protein uup
MIVLDVQGLAASRPNRPLFADVSFTVSDGDRIGVVGLNGCGKSTLLRIVSGEADADAGVVRRGRNARIGILAQEPVLPVGTVRDAVGQGWQGEAMLQRFGMGDMLDARTDQLSGGQRKRTALAALLAGEWEALILDEPTNHLDLDAISYLEQWLASYNGGLLLVTHDRHVLDRVTTKVLEIDRGHAYLHIPTGIHAGSGYAAYLAARVEREEAAATAEQVRKNSARRELAWLRRGAPARSTKPKARVDAAKALIAQKADGPARQGDLGLTFGSQRLGSKGAELHGVGYEWPATDKTPSNRVLMPFDHALEPGDRLGIVGSNGAGKSTLLDLIAQRITPTEGHIDFGRTVKVGYYDQLGRDLNVNQRVRDAVAGDKGAPSVEDIGLMRRFWFDGDAQFAPIHTLSGGERRRLQLLLTLVEEPNVLLLDEPTNDLDLDTLRALEDYLDDWPGIVVVVSHDRAFLDRTVNEVLALDGNGNAGLVRDGVAGWLRQRAAMASTGTSVPKGSAGSASSAGTAPTGKVKPRTTSQSPSTLKRLMEKAEKKLASASANHARITSELADSSNDHMKLAQLVTDLAEAQAAVERAEEDWLAYADQLEALGITPD